MKTLGLVLLVLWAAALSAQNQPGAHAARIQAGVSGQDCTCVDQAASAQKESAALERSLAGLRARMTMLRNDAGIVADQQVRDALQVDAEMWASVIEMLQQRADRLKERTPAKVPPSPGNP
jgi:polyribonucleotide nucleotidyltransferase